MSNTRDITARLDLSTNTSTGPIEVRGVLTCAIQATWGGLFAFDSQLFVETSLDGVGWNEFDSPTNRETLDSDTPPNNTQIWVITELQTSFIRLYYESNNNNAGVAEIVVSFSDRRGANG